MQKNRIRVALVWAICITAALLITVCSAFASGGKTATANASGKQAVASSVSGSTDASGSDAASSASGSATSVSASGSAVLSTWDTDLDCTSCHKDEADSTSDSKCLVSKHATAGATCTTCHNDGTTLDALHAKVKASDTMPTELTQTTVSQDVCLSCHKTADLVAATADCTLLTDTNGTTVNPHDLPVNDTHAQNITCADCHMMHAKRSVKRLAPKLCRSCHHAGVYECFTCHK